MPLLDNYVSNFPHCTPGLCEGRAVSHLIRALGYVCPIVGAKYTLSIIYTILEIQTTE